MAKAFGCLAVGFVVVAIGAVNIWAGIFAMFVGLQICRELFSP